MKTATVTLSHVSITYKRVVATFVFLTLLGGTPLWAQPGFPDRGVEIVANLYAGVNPQNDDLRRAAIRKVCEAMATELGPNWGGKKRAGLGDEFRSPDSIAYREADGSVSVWDVQTSSGQITVFPGKAPDYPRLPASEAAFMSCVVAGEPPQVPPPVSNPPPVIVLPPSTPPVDLSGLERKLDQLIADVAAHEQQEALFREQARGIWKEFFAPVLEFSLKYIAPVVAGWFIGKEANQ